MDTLQSKYLFNLKCIFLIKTILQFLKYHWLLDVLCQFSPILEARNHINDFQRQIVTMSIRSVEPYFFNLDLGKKEVRGESSRSGRQFLIKYTQRSVQLRAAAAGYFPFCFPWTPCSVGSMFVLLRLSACACKCVRAASMLTGACNQPYRRRLCQIRTPAGTETTLSNYLPEANQLSGHHQRAASTVRAEAVTVRLQQRSGISPQSSNTRRTTFSVGSFIMFTNAHRSTERFSFSTPKSLTTLN